MVFLLASFLISSACAAWTISPDWTIGGDWTISTEGADSYTLTIVIADPKNQTYNTSSVAVALNSFGNDTGSSVYSWNFMYSNGSWLYAVNHTTTSETMSIMGNATGTFCALVERDHASDYGEVGLTVNIILTDTYTLNLVISDPDEAIYLSSTIPVSLTTTGNDTASSYSWNVLTDGVWLYGANQTGSAANITATGNYTATFCCYVAGNHLTSDYGEVEFMVYYISTDEPPVIPPSWSEPETDVNGAMPIILLGVIIATVAASFLIKMERD